MPLGFFVRSWGPIVKLTFWGWAAPEEMGNDYPLGTLPDWAAPLSPVSVPASSDRDVWIVVEKTRAARFQMASGHKIAKGQTVFWTFTYLR